MSEQAQNAAPAVVQESAPAEQTNQETNSDQGDSSNLEALENKDTSSMTKAEKQEHQKRIEKFKLKIDGEEIEESLDLNDLEAVKKHLQMSKASGKRMKEAAELRKAAEEFIDILKKDPRKIMKELGLNEKELAQAIMNEELAEMEKTPEQKKIEALQKELEEIQNSKKKEEEERKKNEFERMKQEAEAKIESDISSALETGGIAKTPYTVKKMAEIMYIALENNIDLKPQDVVPLLRKQMEADFKEFFAATNDDQLEEFLKDQLPRIRKRNVAKAKQAEPVKTVKEPTSVSTQSDEVKKIKLGDWLKPR